MAAPLLSIFRPAGQSLLDNLSNNPFIGGTILAAQEAIPAVFGTKRTDTNIDPKMTTAIIEAKKLAENSGRKNVKYEDYNNSTPGGFAAARTFGQIADNEFKRDDKGNITGVVQRYDTNKSPTQALSEFNISNPSTYYKPVEAFLSSNQNKGVTTHDINFSSPVTIKSNKPPQPASYKVQQGDTLTSIANSMGVNVSELAKRNNIANANLINIGQTIV